MKFLIFLLSIFVYSSAQSISCLYYQNPEYGYTCNLIIFNTVGFDNFESINGTHLEGKTDADVLAVVIFDGETANIPRILCNRFKNVEHIDLEISFITTLTEDNFVECPNLVHLNLWQNYITEVPENIFRNNPRLRYVDFDLNRLTNISENTFAHLSDLEILVLRNNAFGENIPAGTFRNLRNLTNLYLDGCRITELKVEWFTDLVSLRYLELFYNLIRGKNLIKFKRIKFIQSF
jgi:Leucine-rich repeat (LRR) protein